MEAESSSCSPAGAIYPLLVGLHEGKPVRVVVEFISEVEECGECANELEDCCCEVEECACCGAELEDYVCGEGPTPEPDTLNRFLRFISL